MSMEERNRKWRRNLYAKELEERKYSQKIERPKKEYRREKIDKRKAEDEEYAEAVSTGFE